MVYYRLIRKLENVKVFRKFDRLQSEDCLRYFQWKTGDSSIMPFANVSALVNSAGNGVIIWDYFYFFMWFVAWIFFLETSEIGSCGGAKLHPHLTHKNAHNYKSKVHKTLESNILHNIRISSSFCTVCIFVLFLKDFWTNLLTTFLSNFNVN